MGAVAPLRGRIERAPIPGRAPVARETAPRDPSTTGSRPRGRFRRAPAARQPLMRYTSPLPTRTVTAVAGAPSGALRVAPQSHAERDRPQLAVVRPRRGRAISVVVICCALLFSLLLGAVAFQTRLAQNQLSLDRTERAVREARDRYDILRRQRAQLRAPNRLAIEATRLGMGPAETGELMTIDPSIVAHVAVWASGLPEGVSERDESFEQFGNVKAVTGDVP